MPAVESCLIPAGLERLTPVADRDAGLGIVPERVADLRDYLALVPDPRDRWDRRGVRHSAGSLLALAAAAGRAEDQRDHLRGAHYVFTVKTNQH